MLTTIVLGFLQSRHGCMDVVVLRVIMLGVGRSSLVFVFFFQAEDGIRDKLVTGVQTCALPISAQRREVRLAVHPSSAAALARALAQIGMPDVRRVDWHASPELAFGVELPKEIGRASCRERV